MMNLNEIYYFAAVGLAACTCFASGDRVLSSEEIRIRDPFIYADDSTQVYYMYAQSGNREDAGYQGVEVYTSTDLKTWAAPVPVLTVPEEWKCRSVWAPEMLEYNGRFYLFVTLTFEERLVEEKPVAGKWPEMYRRGTFVYFSDSPAGPFRPFKTSSHTPESWMALDGTLYVEDETPYMIFCHEWVQVVDGTVEYVQLKDDLSDTLGQPEFMFKASDVPTAVHPVYPGKITDGCFLYKSPKTDRLFMIWSTFVPGKGYCEILSYSETGSIKGPWMYQKIIYPKNGGHGMIFETFEGQLVMALHQPNNRPKERLALFEIMDHGETLEIVDKLR